MEGTNCEYETYLAFKDIGAIPEFVHLKELEQRTKRLDNYHCIFIPGGFSAGDYVRAGAIFAARIKAHFMRDLKKFVDNGCPVVGVCNGFQVLIELGLLPALDGISDEPEATLATNDSNRYECRQTLLKYEKGRCILTSTISDESIQLIPSAHKEGKLIFKNDEYGEEVNHLQVVYRYVDEKGGLSGYPWNPNGSFANIAGICNHEGNVLGMMPHPERAFHKWQNMNMGNGDGRAVFEGIVSYIEKKW